MGQDSNIPYWSGSVVELYRAETAEASQMAVERAHLVAGRGMEGDRYFLGTGTHCATDSDQPYYEITLIENETIEAIRRERKLELDQGIHRRNIVTRGFALNHLVGRHFRIGPVVLYGLALCEPCPHLGDLTSHSIMVSLLHRGGLGARIVTTGTIHVGDTIEAIEGQ